MGQAHSAKNGQKVAKKTGRPSKYSMEQIVRISDRVAKGLTLAQACILETPPITDSESVRNAINHNPAFSTAYKTAHAVFVDEAVNRLRVSSAKEVSGLIFLLKCRHKEQFSERLEVTDPNDGRGSAAIPVEFLNSLAEAAQANPLLVPIRQKATANPTRN